jgi:uncharacterized protein YciI
MRKPSDSYLLLLLLTIGVFVQPATGAGWTAECKAALDRHFVRFQHAIETGELILAGRTRETGDKTFGIAIFQAADETAARKFMKSDPAVVAGLMTTELHPFAVALEHNKP